MNLEQTPILELSPIGFYMAYRLLYGTGVISGIGERSDHSTVSVELASSHVPWDVFSSTIVYLIFYFLGGLNSWFQRPTRLRADSIRSLPDSIRGLLCYPEVTIRAYTRIVAYSN